MNTDLYFKVCNMDRVVFQGNLTFVVKVFLSKTNVYSLKKYTNHLLLDLLDSLQNKFPLILETPTLLVPELDSPPSLLSGSSRPACVLVQV